MDFNENGDQSTSSDQNQCSSTGAEHANIPNESTPEEQNASAYVGWKPRPNFSHLSFPEWKEMQRKQREEKYKKDRASQEMLLIQKLTKEGQGTPTPEILAKALKEMDEQKVTKHPSNDQYGIFAALEAEVMEEHKDAEDYLKELKKNEPKYILRRQKANEMEKKRREEFKKLALAGLVPPEEIQRLKALRVEQERRQRERYFELSREERYIQRQKVEKRKTMTLEEVRTKFKNAEERRKERLEKSSQQRPKKVKVVQQDTDQQSEEIEEIENEIEEQLDPFDPYGVVAEMEQEEISKEACHYQEIKTTRTIMKLLDKYSAAKFKEAPIPAKRRKAPKPRYHPITKEERCSRRIIGLMKKQEDEINNGSNVIDEQPSTEYNRSPVVDNALTNEMSFSASSYNQSLPPASNNNRNSMEVDPSTSINNDTDSLSSQIQMTPVEMIPSSTHLNRSNFGELENEKCKVCGDQASGFHYGALTCKGCKEFFCRHKATPPAGRCFKHGECNITTQTRTYCQPCRYKKCLEAGMMSYSVSSEMIPSTTHLNRLNFGRLKNGKCEVCGDWADGFHYGALTCEGCKAFFRRNKETPPVGICFKQGTCKITAQTRHRCQPCRYKKCLEVGMTDNGRDTQKTKRSIMRILEENSGERKVEAQNVGCQAMNEEERQNMRMRQSMSSNVENEKKKEMFTEKPQEQRDEMYGSHLDGKAEAMPEKDVLCPVNGNNIKQRSRITNDGLHDSSSNPVVSVRDFVKRRLLQDKKVLAEVEQLEGLLGANQDKNEMLKKSDTSQEPLGHHPEALETLNTAESYFDDPNPDLFPKKRKLKEAGEREVECQDEMEIDAANYFYPCQPSSTEYNRSPVVANSVENEMSSSSSSSSQSLPPASNNNENSMEVDPPTSINNDTNSSSSQIQMTPVETIPSTTHLNRSNFGELENEECQVCGDQANGFHYGAMTCEGCKTFFRRKKAYRSAGFCANGKCEMTVKTRNYCQPCRFKKCLAVGMIVSGPRKYVSRNLDTQETKSVVMKILEEHSEEVREEPQNPSENFKEVDAANEKEICKEPEIPQESLDQHPDAASYRHSGTLQKDPIEDHDETKMFEEEDAVETEKMEEFREEEIPTKLESTINSVSEPNYTAENQDAMKTFRKPEFPQDPHDPHPDPVIYGNSDGFLGEPDNSNPIAVIAPTHNEIFPEAVRPSSVQQATKDQPPTATSSQPPLEKPPKEKWSLRKLKELLKVIPSENSSKWKTILDSFTDGDRIETSLLDEFLQLAKQEILKNVSIIDVLDICLQLTVLYEFKIPLPDYLIEKISKDSIFQLDDKKLLVFCCNHGKNIGQRNIKKADNLNKFQHELLRMMRNMSKEDKEEYWSNEYILSFVKMDKRKGFSEDQIIQEIEKVKKYIASNDNVSYATRLKVLKATRTAVTRELLFTVSNIFSVDVDSNFVIRKLTSKKSKKSEISEKQSEQGTHLKRAVETTDISNCESPNAKRMKVTQKS